MILYYLKKYNFQNDTNCRHARNIFVFADEYHVLLECQNPALKKLRKNTYQNITVKILTCGYVAQWANASVQ